MSVSAIQGTSPDREARKASESPASKRRSTLFFLLTPLARYPPAVLGGGVASERNAF